MIKYGLFYNFKLHTITKVPIGLGNDNGSAQIRWHLQDHFTAVCRLDNGDIVYMPINIIPGQEFTFETDEGLTVAWGNLIVTGTDLSGNTTDAVTTIDQLRDRIKRFS